jgi:predicted SAM-dependent methyltransferase
MDVLNLHICGKEIHPNWKILDIEPRSGVDYVANASDLSQFPDNSVDKIYASHVLQHFYYLLEDELVRTLIEWHRVLKPDGCLMLSVPDLKTLCWLFVDPSQEACDRYAIMAELFGTQKNQYDWHKVGFDFEILTYFLQKAGFCDYQRVTEFTMFNDSSSRRISDRLVSLNVIAKKSRFIH